MRNKVLGLLIFTLIIGFINLSQVYAEDRLLLLGSSEKVNLYLDSDTLAVTKNDTNSIYYDVWIKMTIKEDIQQLNMYTQQQEPLGYLVQHMVIATTKDRKMSQLRSTTAYGKSDEVLFTYNIAKPMADIAAGSIVDYLAGRIAQYVSNHHFEAIVAPNEKYLPFNQREYYDLFETKGYKISKIEKSQGINIYGEPYSSAATTSSFLGKDLDKEAYLGVFGDDEQHLKGASAVLYTNSLLSKEDLSLFYITLQELFPDWTQDQSKNWVDQSLEKMSLSNKIMFIHLHKGKDYITITRQDIKGNKGIVYKLTITQNDPAKVNPIRPYNDGINSISIFEEWKPSQSN